MSVDVLLKLVAAQQRRAVPRTTLRHTHLHPRPLVVAGYHLAGEPGAPVALMYGTAPDEFTIVAVAEPRNRDQRFAALGTFARDLSVYLDAHWARQAVESSDGPVEICTDAPQLVVPNGPTATWVTDLLGRSLRYLPTEGDRAVDAVLPTAGTHLTWFASRRVIPGSAALVAATDLLTTHFATGQLRGEDANLATVLAWVGPPAGVEAPAAAAEAERLPPAGPVSDPAWDRLLQSGIGDLAAVREASEEALAPAWRNTWAALDTVRPLPEAPHVAGRWEWDRRAWTRHCDRVAEGKAYFSRRTDQINSFRLLAELERRTLGLERQMALDDPYVMASHVASGDALAGVVTHRDLEHRISLPTGRRGLRPLLQVRPVVPFEGPLNTELGWAENPRVKTRVIAVDGGEVTLRVEAGACQSVDTAARILPDAGSRIVLATFAGEPYYPDNLPEELPWTHTP